MSAVAEITETTTTEMPTPIVFTDSAAAKVADLIAEEGNPDLKLRVFVQGGGCSGFQYGFTFDEITNDDDTTDRKSTRLNSSHSQISYAVFCLKKKKKSRKSFPSLARVWLEQADDLHCKHRWVR